MWRCTLRPIESAEEIVLSVDNEDGVQILITELLDLSGYAESQQCHVASLSRPGLKTSADNVT
jgi:hypothetical protein